MGEKWLTDAFHKSHIWGPPCAGLLLLYAIFTFHDNYYICCMSFMSINVIWNTSLATQKIKIWKFKKGFFFQNFEILKNFSKKSLKSAQLFYCRFEIYGCGTKTPRCRFIWVPSLCCKHPLWILLVIFTDFTHGPHMGPHWEHTRGAGLTYPMNWTNNSCTSTWYMHYF